MKTIFLRALEAGDKAAVLRAAIHEPEIAHNTHRFELDPASFAMVPQAPFAYWLSERLRRLFKELPAFESETRTARVGLGTSDDFRFVRVWWEVPSHRLRKRWFSFAKGGNASPYYTDFPLVVNWELGDSDARELKAFLECTPGTNHWSRRAASSDRYFSPGLTWPLRAARFSPQALPAGCVFSVRGYSAFVPETELAWTLSVFNSSIFDYLFKTTLGRYGFPEFIVGILQSLPWRSAPPEAREARLSVLARHAWSLKRILDTRIETSHAFALPVLLQTKEETLAARASAWTKHVCAADEKLSTIQAEIDANCFGLYGIDEDDRRAITASLRGGADVPGEPEDVEADADEDADDENDPESKADAASLAADLISWAAGVAFGRFDMRLATGARLLLAEPEPFDPLPACSQAMLTGDDGLPLTISPAAYPIAFPENGLLVDDPGHARDFIAVVRVVFDVIFENSSDAWWNDIEALLGPKGGDLRLWLATAFFDHHLKRHSKSRRKSPIIWQIAVPSGRYSIWIYAHRVSRDTFIQIQNDLVAPKLGHEEHHLASLKQSAGANPSSKESKEIETREAFVEELRDLLDKVKHVAPLWRPTLDDGVVLTMAPLWRLVPQHRPWQKELKSKWDDLVAGKYDWAHLAMHLWPERVIPKCAEDRSLAITHGLEDVFWFEDQDGKWTPYKKPKKPIADLVSERTSAAVKAALKSLLDSPEPASGIKRSRKSKVA
jgi:hypothetical protein